MKGPIIVKLGGSVITHKETSPPRINQQSVNRIVMELRVINRPLVLVLGGGAHGHQPAEKHGFGNPSSTINERLAGVPEIRQNMNLLASEIVAKLSDNSIPSVIIPPMSISKLENGKIISMDLYSARSALKAGIVVVTHGDVCFDEKLGAAILSGDTLSVFLAKKLAAEAVYIGTNVDGIMNGNPDTNSNAKLIPIIKTSEDNSILKLAGPSKATDVTGGMNKKLKELFKLANDDIEIVIFNLNVAGRLGRLLTEKSVKGTRILP